MQAVILAAGRGSRLERLTARRPKVLLRLSGRSLLDWQLAALRAAGVERITLVGGYRAEALPQLEGVRIVHNGQWQHSGPIASLACADPAALGDFLLVYGDGVFHPDLVRALGAAGPGIAVAGDRRWRELWERRFERVSDDAESFQAQDGWLTAIGARVADAAEIEAQFAGMVRFDAGAWTRVENHLAALPPERAQRLDCTALLAGLLERGEPIRAVDVHGRWCEVDSARDLALYRLLARKTPGWSHDWRWEDERCAAPA